MTQNQPDAAAVARTSQIIAGALTAGVVIFAVIAAVQGLAQPPDPEQQPIISYVGIFAAFMAAAAAMIVPINIAAAQRRNLPRPPGAHGGGDPRDTALRATFQTCLIVRLALLEGAAFLNLYAAMYERRWWGLAVAGLLLLFMLMNFPTYGRVEQFVRQQRELADLEGGHDPR
jgi:hypothetical protein